ncbi:MAG: major facilitator superfamily 1 [Anaerospora sp.]|nr:major facilitator superfamily 1 [Anaerospora sp.]
MSVLVQLFSNRQFQSIAFVQMLTVFSTNLLAPILPVHFKLQGLSESEIGFIMGIVSLGALVVRPWSGMSVDLRGSRWRWLFMEPGPLPLPAAWKHRKILQQRLLIFPYLR